MDKEQEMDPRFHFSNDPDEEMSFENEILKLKLQAERGAIFGGNREDFPPGTEAQFLQNVVEFENAFENAKQITIYQCIGEPPYKKLDELTTDKVEVELHRLVDLLYSKNIVLDVLGQHEPSVIYTFVTEELFNEKVTEIDLPDFMQVFIYEEFHPDHNMDIGRTAQEFFDHWFQKEFDENSIELAAQLVTADGKMFSRNEVISKLCNCLNSFRKFSNIGFMGCDTGFEWDEKEGKGMGHAEGMFRYDAETENGETIHFEEPFKLYMSNEDGYWRIFYFVFPGFVW